MAATMTIKGVQREVKCLTFNFDVISSTTGDVATGFSLPAGAIPVAVCAKVNVLCGQSQDVSFKVGGVLITGTIATNTHLNVAGEWVNIPVTAAAVAPGDGAVTVTLGGAITTGDFDFSICYIM